MAHTSHGHGHAEGDHGEVHHESSDVDIRGIFTFVIALVLVTAVTYGVVWVLFLYLGRNADRALAGRVYPLAADQADRLPPEPRLQTNPRGDLGDLRASERELLESYSWVDRNAGIVRIPLDDAMRLTIQRGLPSREVAR